jgi:hypothetical protein
MPNQPRPDNRPHMIRVPDELWDEAKRKADQRSENISELFRAFLRRYVRKSV